MCFVTPARNDFSGSPDKKQIDKKPPRLKSPQVCQGWPDKGPDVFMSGWLRNPQAAAAASVGPYAWTAPPVLNCCSLWVHSAQESFLLPQPPAPSSMGDTQSIAIKRVKKKKQKTNSLKAIWTLRKVFLMWRKALRCGRKVQKLLVFSKIKDGFKFKTKHLLPPLIWKHCNWTKGEEFDHNSIWAADECPDEHSQY